MKRSCQKLMETYSKAFERENAFISRLIGDATSPINPLPTSDEEIQKENESESWSKKSYKIALSPHRKWLICPLVRDRWLHRGENRDEWISWIPNPFPERSDKLAVTPWLSSLPAWHWGLRIWIWLALPICCTIRGEGTGRDSLCFPHPGLLDWRADT